jgi:hypothetical protein
MKTTKGILIFLAMAVMIVFNTQPALGGSTCPYDPDLPVCIFTSVDQGGLWDPGFHGGTKVECSAMAYYETVQTEDHILPEACCYLLGCPNPCSDDPNATYCRCSPSPLRSPPISCPGLCGDEYEAYLMLIIRAKVGRDSPKHFLLTLDTAPDPCDMNFRPPKLGDFGNEDKCKCKRDFAIENGLDRLPICLKIDMDLVEDFFKGFIRTEMLKGLFGDGDYTNTNFAVTSITKAAITNPDNELPPFYGIFDFVLVVK